MSNSLLNLAKILHKDFTELGIDYSKLRTFEKDALYLSVSINEFINFYDFLLKFSLYPDSSYESQGEPGSLSDIIPEPKKNKAVSELKQPFSRKETYSRQKPVSENQSQAPIKREINNKEYNEASADYISNKVADHKTNKQIGQIRKKEKQALGDFNKNIKDFKELANTLELMSTDSLADNITEASDVHEKKETENKKTNNTSNYRKKTYSRQKPVLENQLQAPIKQEINNKEYNEASDYISNKVSDYKTNKQIRKKENQALGDFNKNIKDFKELANTLELMSTDSLADNITEASDVHEKKETENKKTNNTSNYRKETYSRQKPVSENQSQAPIKQEINNEASDYITNQQIKNKENKDLRDFNNNIKEFRKLGSETYISDVMDAITDEISREYKRFYGE